MYNRDMDHIQLPDFSPRYPPCLVCSGKGSGLHFGVNTCDPCKGFFSRCATRKTALKCKFQENCTIHFETKPCASCRYKKCVALGMSKNAIKKGRDSCSQRTKVIEQVQRLELQAKINKDGTLKAINDHEKEMDDIVKLLTDTRLECLPNTAEHLETVVRNQKQYMEHKALENQLYGSRRAIHYKEYNEIYNQTGLDVDGRKKLLQEAAPILQQAIDDLFRFAQQIPGFSRLPQQDQKKVMKYSAAEVSLFFYTQYIDVEHAILIQPYNPSVVVQIEEMMVYCDNPAEIQELTLRFHKRLQNLDLTITETNMAAALAFMIADVKVCKYSKTILSSSADYLVEVLQREINKNHDPEEHTMAKIILLITDMRQFTEVALQASKDFVIDCLELGIPKVMYDIYVDENNQ